MQNLRQPPPEEAERLLSEYARQPSAALRERLVEMHLYIAQIIARKFSGRGVDYDDLFQVASLALVKALDRFDPARGIRFPSFATPNMVGEVKNYFRDRSRTIRAPRRGVALMRDIDRAMTDLAQRLSRMPRSDELAGALNVPEDAVLEALELGAGGVVPLDGAPDDMPSLAAFLGVEEAGYAEFEQKDAIRRAMDGLEPRQREIIRLRYYENLSQREIAGRLNVSQMTVSREERRALEGLRQRVREPLDQE